MPSSLTEGHSFTWGEFSLPTGVGLRYGQNTLWLAAFLGGLGPGDFRPLAEARASCHGCVTGLSLGHPLQPASPSCPFDGFTLLTASPLRSSELFWCRTFLPACHRLRLLRPRLRSRLTLGRLPLPRNPQACGVRGSHTHHATHSGIRSSARSTRPRGRASLLRTTLPYHAARKTARSIHGFGSMLEPRYVLGARALDQ